MKKYVYVMLTAIVVLVVIMVVSGDTGSKVSQVSLGSFEQTCNSNGDEWMKMEPMKDGRFTSNVACFGCMADTGNHICELDAYLSFEASSDAEIIKSSVSSTSEIFGSGLNKLEVSISSMSCSSCSIGIASLLNDLNGVVEASINFNGKTGEIIYDPVVITQEEIMNSDAFSSYSGEVVSDVKLE